MHRKTSAESTRVCGSTLKTSGNDVCHTSLPKWELLSRAYMLTMQPCQTLLSVPVSLEEDPKKFAMIFVLYSHTARLQNIQARCNFKKKGNFLLQQQWRKIIPDGTALSRLDNLLDRISCSMRMRHNSMS